MKNRRLTIVGLSLLTAVSLAVGGCAKSDSGQSAKGAAKPSPSPTDAKTALLASVEQLSKTTYKFHLDSEGASSGGVSDPVNSALMISINDPEDGGTGAIEIIIIQKDVWVKMDLGDANELLGIPAGKYMHETVTKIGKGSVVAAAQEGTDMVSDLFPELVDVRQVDSQHFSGIVDLTKIPDNSVFDKDAWKAAGNKAKAAPFTASVDSRGRITELKIDMAAIGVADPLEVSYSDYGTPVTISKPDPAKTIEAPSSVHGVLGGALSPSSTPSTK